jgi:two-component system, OmpR family, phosphate regulon response regulator PhoB
VTQYGIRDPLARSDEPSAFLRASVVVIDYDERFTAAFDAVLAGEGFLSHCAHSARDGFKLVSETEPDLVVLEVALPDASGLDFCRTLRERPRTLYTPILIVSSNAEENDRVLGFEAGADDFVAKPVSVRELILRMRAALRRSQPHGAARVRRARDLEIDPATHRAWVARQEISLTALEFKLLLWLVDHPGKVFTRDKLLEEVWSMSGDLTTRTIDTHVKRLRQKLGPAARYIETLRGVGYRFTDPSACARIATARPESCERTRALHGAEPMRAATRRFG